MRRRQFITLLGGAAAAWPSAVRAQQPVMPVIGYLSPSSPDNTTSENNVAAFRKGLSENGYVEGRNVAIEYRWANTQIDQLPALAADLVRHQVAVIFEFSTLPIASKAATSTIPIVFVTPDDPVAFGLVASLNRPGGNLTGATILTTEVLPKRLELLHELLPTAAKIALLINPTNHAAETQSKDVKAAGRALGREIDVLNASSERDFDTVFANLAQLRAGGLVIAGDSLFGRRSEQLAAFALRHAVPAIFQSREFTAAGGLMSYGPSIPDAYHLAGVYTGRILKGEKPADLPVQQATKFELIINLKTAMALGLAVPLLLLGRADEIIE
jgi:putative ABC transport system substrate-binding protein